MRHGLAVLAVVLFGLSAMGADSCSTDTSDHPQGASETGDKPPAASKPPAATKAKATQKTRRYHGNGGRTLPRFTLAEDSTLKWTNDGDYFGVYDTPDQLAGVPVNSQAHSGETTLDAGEHKLEINGVGNWTIKISAGT